MEMEEKMALMKLLLFLTVTVHLSSAACFRHLQFYYTGNIDGETAEALLDGEQFVYYEKSKEIVIPTTEWMKKIENDDGEHWEDLTNKLKDGLRSGRDFVGTAVSSSNWNEGYQLTYGCKLNRGTESGYWKFGYDGKYLLSLNLNDGTWTAENNESERIKQKMEKEGNLQKAFLQNECILWLQTYMDCESNSKADVKDPLSRRRRSAEEKACSAQVTHSVQFFYTAVTGINFPEFTAVSLVDGVQISYYDSDIRKKIPKTEWIKKVVGDMPDYWDRATDILQGQQESFKVNVQTLMQRFNQTKGVHTVQFMYGCELDEETKRGYMQHGYDGEDFLILDLNSGTYVAPVSQAVSTKQKYDRVGETSRAKNYLENECIEWLKKYVGYGKSVLERKVRPEVSLFQKGSPSEVVCHATGFFPKAVMISWQKNGEELNEDVDLRETLPNQDGTFQKRSILTVSPEELKNNQYTCVIQHSSLRKELVLLVSDHKVLSGNGVSVGLIVGVVVGALLLVIIICTAVFIWKRNSSGVTPVSVNFRSCVTPDSASVNSGDSFSINSDSPAPSPSPDVVAAKHLK